MKGLQILLSGFFMLTPLSCGKKKDSDLGIQMSGSNTYLIDAKSQSCTNRVAAFTNPISVSPASDVPALYYTLQGATLTWKNATDVAYIIKMEIEFKSVDLTHTCTISGNELLSVFYDFTTPKAWDGTLPAATSSSPLTVLTSQCPIRCGSITVADKAKSFTATGILTLVGFQRSPTGEEKPISVQTDVKLSY